MAKQKQAEECVLYVRVSTTRQAEDGVSIDAQIAKGKANAEFRNLLLPDENIFIVYADSLPVLLEGGRSMCALLQNFWTGAAKPCLISSGEKSFLM